MTRTVLTVFIAVLTLFDSLSAQEIELPKGRSIRVGDYVSLAYLPNISLRADSNSCCPTHQVIGTVIAIEEDQLRIQADEQGVAGPQPGSRRRRTIHEPIGTGPSVVVDRKEIFSGSVARSEKHHRARSNLRNTGGIMIFAGLFSGASALVLPDFESRKRLALVGSGEVAAGIGFLFAGKRQKFVLRESPKLD